MRIHDHGELDYLTPAPTEADQAIADAARHAIAQQRYFLNTQERVRQEQSKARALYAQGERDFHTHKKPEGQS